MSSLPAWLTDLQQTLPAWLAQLSHPDGPGRYRFALDAYEPYDLDSTTMAWNTIQATGCVALSEADRQGWGDYLTGLQRAEDGLMIDAGMERHIITEHPAPTAEEVATVRRWTTRNGLMTLLNLGGTPRFALAHDEAFTTPEEMVAYLEGLHWHNPWGAGSWAGAVIFFQYLNQRMGDPNAARIIQTGVDWLLARQEPGLGGWSDGSDVAPHVYVNGIFKVWIQLLACADFPIQYPEAVLDTCLTTWRESAALTGVPDACSIFDVAFVADVALRYTDHRRDEVAELAAAAFLGFEPLLRADGAFSYTPTGSLQSHGGLHLGPVKDQSDLPGTAILTQAVALLANLAGLRDELGWTPMSEWWCGLR